MNQQPHSGGGVGRFLMSLRRPATLVLEGPSLTEPLAGAMAAMTTTGAGERKSRNIFLESAMNFRKPLGKSLKRWRRRVETYHWLEHSGDRNLIEAY